jgi:RNA polymerase sigma-70 factor (ECF subfamily)
MPAETNPASPPAAASALTPARGGTIADASYGVGTPEAPPVAALSPAMEEAARRLYPRAIAERFAVSLQEFLGIVSEVLTKAAAANARTASAVDPAVSETERLELLGLLRVEELVLARACAAGNEAAWEEFLSRYRARLYEAALAIAHDEATARELADGIYAELYGLSSKSGARTGKLSYYMGRGSLEGWLRTVLAQTYVDRYRAQRHTVSLEEQVEAGAAFAAPATETAVGEAAAQAPDPRLEKATAAALSTLTSEDKFLLAAYYLDRQTLAELGRQLRVHESTISRKLERLARELRKAIRRQLLAEGMSSRQADECIEDADVRDLRIDIRESLGQENVRRPFYKGDDSKP